MPGRMGTFDVLSGVPVRVENLSTVGAGEFDVSDVVGIFQMTN